MRRCSRQTDLTDFVRPRQHRKKQTHRQAETQQIIAFPFILVLKDPLWLDGFFSFYLASLQIKQPIRPTRDSHMPVTQCGAFNFSNPVCGAPASRPFSEEKGQTNALPLKTAVVSSNLTWLCASTCWVRANIYELTVSSFPLIFTSLLLHFKRNCLNCIALMTLVIIYCADSDDLVLIEFTCYVGFIRILSKSTKSRQIENAPPEKNKDKQYS